MRWTWSRSQLLGAVVLVPGSLCFIVLRCAFSPEFSFISRAEPWIMAPAPVTAQLQQWGTDVVPAARFTRHVELESIPRSVLARVRALRGFELAVNGTRVPMAARELSCTTDALAERDPSDWRAETLADLTSILTLGDNEIALTVCNAHGPALLSARFEGLARPGEATIRTDSSWQVSVEGGVESAAIAASDTRLNPASLTAVAPARAFSRNRDSALLFFMMGVLGFAGGRTLLCRKPEWRSRLPVLALCSGVLVWLSFLPRFLEIPLSVGFDARHHLSYLDFLSENRVVPLASEGWSMFHPPLFYVLTALTEWALGSLASDAAPRLALRFIPFAAGLATLLIAFVLTRRLLPRSWRAQAFAVAFATLLPVNIYSSAYFSNESLHTALSGGVVLGTVLLLLARRTAPFEVAMLGTLLGLALLTKFTAAVLVPIALFFLVCKQLAVERAPWARAFQTGLAFALPILAVAGWYYARNWLEFGHVFMANWDDVPGAGRTWWQQPGFRTLDYYLSFGASLTHPFLSGFESMWDSVYSTWWGDGFVAGRVNPADRHPYWNYDFMAMAYWASLPATALIFLGGGLAVRRAFRDPDAGRRAAFTFLTTTTWAVAFGFLYLSVKVPFYSQAKAPYGLVLAAPLALFFSLGAERCDEALAARTGTHWLALRAVFYGWLALWLGVLLRSFTG